jgi:predicted protein tyrosine phosphatase
MGLREGETGEVNAETNKLAAGTAIVTAASEFADSFDHVSGSLVRCLAGLAAVAVAFDFALAKIRALSASLKKSHP